jgi:hypothetical protein
MDLPHSAHWNSEGVLMENAHFMVGIRIAASR